MQADCKHSAQGASPRFEPHRPVERILRELAAGTALNPFARSASDFPLPRSVSNAKRI
jgi:hypothetical protein